MCVRFGESHRSRVERLAPRVPPRLRQRAAAAAGTNIGPAGRHWCGALRPGKPVGQKRAPLSSRYSVSSRFSVQPGGKNHFDGNGLTSTENVQAAPKPYRPPATDVGVRAAARAQAHAYGAAARSAQREREEQTGHSVLSRLGSLAAQRSRAATGERVTRGRQRGSGCTSGRAEGRRHTLVRAAGVPAARLHTLVAAWSCSSVIGTSVLFRGVNKELVTTRTLKS